MNFEKWVRAHIGELSKIGTRERNGNTYYEYKMTQEDRDNLLTDETCDTVQDYMAQVVADSLIDLFRARNPQYEDENPGEDIADEICGAVWGLINAGTLYDADAQTVNVVMEYHAEDGETYCIVHDERGYAAINKRDIVDGIVMLAYTAIDACASDTAEETLKILRGRIKVSQWRAEGLSDYEIAKLTNEFYDTGE